ncbi:hypothetical protein SAMN05444167_0156 [Terriglobus roseus]|uniref:Uncharacterized protein n=1 Tax=Terriglobus roseus TaxID=392734 RepID=A0A1G7EZF3_9BACT|nr:hypothetical protein SAMN05444167_0156 [Terriglobus roseus]
MRGGTSTGYARGLCIVPEVSALLLRQFQHLVGALEACPKIFLQKPLEYIPI